MTTATTTQADRRAAFQAADDAWSAELQRCFGKRAGDVRYIKAGEGEPKTELRTRYEAFKAAGEAWRRGM